MADCSNDSTDIIDFKDLADIVNKLENESTASTSSQSVDSQSEASSHSDIDSEDAIDAGKSAVERLFGKKSSSKTLNNFPSTPRKRYIIVNEAFEYNMTHRRRGRAIIINNRKFEKHTGLDDRDGSDVDAERLLRTFGGIMGFEAYRYDNLSVYAINDLLEKVSLEDHSDCDCLAVVMLSHGDEESVYGTDGPISIESLTRFFKGNKCPTLAGKPKLFFIQACRGHNYDDGVIVPDGVIGDEVDAKRPQRIPVEADFLICYATVNGYSSWRNPTNGSWFIESLCHVFNHCAASMDMLRMMTRVCRTVAYGYESNTGEELKHADKKKQAPSVVSMLTKDLYFPPKPEITSNIDAMSVQKQTRC